MAQQESFNELKERIGLSREVQISELIVRGKQIELNNEKIKTDELNKNIEDIKNRNNSTKENIEKKREEIKMLISINEKIQQDINKKKKERGDLYEKLQIGIARPVDDDINDSQEEEDIYDFIDDK